MLTRRASAFLALLAVVLTLVIAPVTAAESVANGGFETGALSFWTSTGPTSVVTTAHSGGYAARLGGTSLIALGDSTAAQSFTVPASGATLTFWYLAACGGSVSSDWISWARVSESSS